MKRLLWLLLLGIDFSLIFALSYFVPDSTAHAVHQTVACDEDALREALRTGGTIQLAENCVYRLTQNPPHIQADIVIEGHGATLDGQGMYRLLSSVEMTDITIRDLTLKNGAYGEGGALYVQHSNVTIINSSFEHNQALFGSGGAIWVKHGSLTINSSSFRGNRAYDRGGAIWAGTDDVTVTNSSFTSNEAAVGGGLYAQDGLVTVISSAFFSNAARVDSERSLDYREGNGGGAIFAEKQDVIITNSTFSGNVGITGNNEGYVTVGQGGAVFVLEGNIIILTSTFTQNTAYIGGAVYAHTGVIRSAQSIIAGNHAEMQGADISFEGRFESGGYNLIGDDGGGRLTVVPSDLVNVDPGLREAGDHLFEFDLGSPSRDTIPSEDCASTEDQRGVARPQGSGCDIGAVEMEPTSSTQAGTTPTPASTQILGNEIACAEDPLQSAIAAGGEWKLPAGCQLVLTDDLPDITHHLVLHGNSSIIDGAGQFRLLYASGTANITVDNLTLQNAHGSAIWASRGTVTVTGSTLLDNSTDDIGGGGIYAGSGNVTVSDTLFARNTAPNGGALYAYNGDVTLIHNTFEDNSAMYSGGSIWTGRSPITLTDSVFTGNIARGGHGGGIFVEDGPVSITDSTFNANMAPWDPGFDRRGGAVATESGELTITNSQFNGNSSGTGGAVAALSGTVTITNSTFTGNLGNEGGGLWIGNDNGYLINSVFSGNSAHSGGGGAYTAYGDITITQCAFIDNVAEAGGGLGAFHGAATITNSTFAGNLARGSGGAISSRSRAKIRHTTIVGNSAQDKGGLDGTSYTLAQTILAENISENGVDSEDYYGSLASKGYNIIDYRYAVNLQATDIAVENVGLNSRTTTFYSLAADSPALDTIPPDQCFLSKDQLGTSRPQGLGCDIGAVEMEQTSAGEIVPILPEDGITSSPNDVPCSEDALREAVRVGGELHLAENCHYLLSHDLPLIGFDLTVFGNGAVIDGADTYRLFYTPAMARITLTDLTIQHGYSDTSGGAIHSQVGEVSVNNCVLVNNRAQINGGGIAAGGPLTITNSVVAYNEAGSNGGGVVAESYVTIANSTFAHNNAATGGGLYANNPSPGVDPETETCITHSTFAFNTASSSGGGVWIGDSLWIQNSIISNNDAKEMADLHILANARFFHSRGYNVLGSNPRLFFAETDLVVSDAKFGMFTGIYFPLLATSPALDFIPAVSCNSDRDQRGLKRPQGAGCDSGAVEMEQSGTFIPIPSTPTPIPLLPPVLACTEESLQQAVSMGGTFELPSDCIITLTHDLPAITSDFTLSGNAGVIDGARQYRIFYAIGLADINLRGLTLRNGLSENGGGLFAEAGDVSLINCTLRDNTATENGGGLYAGNGRITITDSMIQYNIAAGEYGSGGGIYVHLGDLHVTNSRILENTANSSGGGIAIESGYAAISSSLFIDNTARLGGGLASRGSGNLSVFDSRFERNSTAGASEQSNNHGGGIYASGDLTVVERSSFVDNISFSGGGLYAEWSEVTITNSTFYGNTALQDHGGALSGYESAITLTHCSLVDNHAGAKAGGVYVHFGTLEMSHTILTGESYPKADTFISHGYNALGDIMDIKLEAFEPNAGIIPLSSDSPALDAVPAGDCASQEDQLGTTRPQGHGCDIGAIEMIQ